MKCFKAILVLCLLVVGAPALAQTTFVSGDCNANITISGGGLTLTSHNGVGNWVGCRAAQAKQSGLLYYEATLNHAPVNTAFGVANGGVGTLPNANGTFQTTQDYAQASNANSTMLRAGDGKTWWNNTSTTTGGSVTSGHTIGFAINMDSNPWQVWTTPDVASLVCNGSGSSGSTAPKWNGSCASDPTLSGTGNPTGVFPTGSTAGTGFAFYLPHWAAWPVWQGNNLDSATFNFGGTSFVGTLPSGYVAWDNSSGNAAYPGPLNPMIINVSNAPGWQATHAYLSPAAFTATGSGTNLTVTAVTGFLSAGATISAYDGTIPSGTTIVSQSSGTTGGSGVYVTSGSTTIAGASAYALGSRVNAGAGWSGSAYTTGSAVCLFAVTNGGQGTSGSSASAFNTACASGTPAGVGGIPGGSWPGATTVTDGGVTWALLTKVDYATLTNAFNDENNVWATSTQFPGFGYIRNAGNIYINFVSFGTPAPCTSASSGSGPTATTTSPISDGTCNWTYLSPLVYSSNANIWKHQNVFDGTQNQQERYNNFPTVTTWYGGAAQQVYGSQQPGEGAVIFSMLHMDQWADHDVTCYGAFGIGSFRNPGCGSPIVWTLTVAPGDSFVDNLTASAPARVDQTKGVTVTNTGTWTGLSGSFFTGMQEPIAFSDNVGRTTRMQLFSLNGNNIDCHHFDSGPGGQHCNNMQFDNNIIQSGSSGYGAVYCDGGCIFVNDLVINGSTTAGTTGFDVAYPMVLIANTTIVGTGASNSTCITNQAPFSMSLIQYQYNVVCLGYTYPYGRNSPATGFPTYLGTNNATDAPAGGYGGTITNSVGDSVITQQLIGVNTSSGCGAGQASPCSGLTAANQLVNPTPGASFDGRIKSTSADIYGAGVNYSLAGGFLNGSTAAPVIDIVGQTWSPRWDIGPEKFAAGTTALVSVNLSGSTFTYSAASSTVIGAVTVTASGGSFTGTLSLTGANSGNFALSSSTIPSNLTCSVSTTCPAAGGPFSDISIVATQAGATGSPLTQPETITGSSPPPSFLRIGGMLSLHH